EVKCRDSERPLSQGAPPTLRKFREGMMAGHARQPDSHRASRGRSIASSFQPTFTPNKMTCAPRVHSNNLITQLIYDTLLEAFTARTVPHYCHVCRHLKRSSLSH